MQPITIRPNVPGRFIQVSVPLARGEFTWSTGVTPVRVYDGSREMPTQCERGMRYPDGSAASIMVYADAGDGNAPASVEVRWEPHRETAEREFEYHEEILAERESFEVLAAGRVTMSGPVVVQRRVSFQSFEAWVTFFHDCAAIRVDTLVHNARPGAPESLVSRLPGVWPATGWETSWVIAEPLADSDGFISDSSTHFFPQRATRIIRAVLAPRGYNWTDAHPMHGWGVATSEWQRVAAWAPHFIPSPDLSYMEASLDAKQRNERNTIVSALANGTQFPPAGNYPMAVRHGFFHPSYSQEGGETSGYGITYGPACDLIQTGSADGLMHAMYQQRMRRDRDRSACIESDGNPSTYEGRKAEIDLGKIRFSADDPGRFDKSGGVTLDGSFNWSRQIPAPPSAERTALLGFETTDWAHRIRATYWDSLLLQLANDPISRFLIRMDGEVARMGWHSGNRDNWDFSAANAGIGLSRDRILGWQAHAMALAYCAGNDNVRSRFVDDLRDLVNIYEWATVKGPTVCALQSGKQVSPPPYFNLYAVCVSIQEGLLTQGFVAAARGIGASLWLDRINRAIRFLLAGSQSVWSAAVWRLSVHQPFAARVDAFSSLSPEYVGAKTDSEQIRGLLGLCILIAKENGESTADAAVLLQQMLGQSPRATLRGMGMGVLDSDSVALSACDTLGLP